jgi:hypothetical protein
MGFLYRLFGIAHLGLHVRRSQQQLCHFRHVFDGWHAYGTVSGDGNPRTVHGSRSSSGDHNAIKVKVRGRVMKKREFWRVYDKQAGRQDYGRRKLR